ncbi:hypothetical protein BO85DRAFT_464003 [Aspergillus piperis CBS 112811]|uniref:Actin-like ATPase domain-containing protein n=1 Tax=Aspergillus piperis CBS 112811 TaxID=1448313 RepID=A0A8G1QVL6_9EURO|nr:hypothetical protein BO85DRAFT_464003 [Aspergillus piperis CBS 112811]RAH52240.1 hypothetical protein BO85DRAFT_464003 [Aspergillus piperis CBS 112811]
MPRIRWFKLELVPDLDLGEGARPPSIHSDCRRMSISCFSSPEKVVTDYLRSLLDSANLEFVITVPAMWPDKAKMSTLSCAEKAGFGDMSTIHIISEPEAAAIHSLRAPGHPLADIGDTFILLFMITGLEPYVRLREEAPGTGSMCDSTFLNKSFEKLLDERLSHLPGWDRDTLDEAMQRYESVVKRVYEGSTDHDFMFPVPEMRKLFLPTIRDIEKLVREQLQTSRAEVKAVLLVGGFGQSPYLRKHLRDCFSPGVQVIAPVDGWTAVVRGALAKTLGDISDTTAKAFIESRKARANYETIYWTYFYGEYCIDVMRWFVRKGDDMEEAKAIKTKWTKRRRIKDGPFSSISVSLYKVDTALGEKPPLYFNRRVNQHATLNPSLGVIEKERIPIERGADNKLYYVVQYEIHAVYYSAHYVYTLWYEGRNYGSVKADYI